MGLFAGIGGLELGLLRAGLDSATLVEIDPAAQAVLRARFPQAEVRSDVAELKQIPPGTTILTAGFPCQNLSMAGDKSGITGLKSGVVHNIFRLVRASRVPMVIIENVCFMLQLDSGAAMTWLVTEFEKLGYDWAYRVLDTMGFGLPQRRRRVYLVASNEIDPRGVLFADETPTPDEPSPDLQRPLGFYWTEGRSGVGLTIDGIPPLKVGSGLGIPSPPAVLFTDGEALVPSLTAAERLQGFEAGWTTIGGDGSNPKPAWRMVGNAVSVPVAKWIGSRVKSPGAVLDFDRKPMERGGRWPNAAWSISGAWEEVTAGNRTVSEPLPSIATFRDSTWSRLSDRALNGFIKRASEGSLHLPTGFLDALRSAPRKPPRQRTRA